MRMKIQTVTVIHDASGSIIHVIPPRGRINGEKPDPERTTPRVADLRSPMHVARATR